GELGLYQGQRLMLIDLDRCTRCDECVHACVNTHADGRSRLFLDGPRFGKYLVPISCRSCLDPVCMIGCPVGSIHRGNNGQIVIEDWCIGCGMCAKQCPYGSIAMHDVGLVPEQSHGWKYMAMTNGDDRWTKPDYRDRSWPAGAAPFRLDPDFRASLLDFPQVKGTPAYCFRREFTVGSDLMTGEYDFMLELTSPDSEAKVWLNGKQIETKERVKRDKRAFPLGKADDTLRSGRNMVAAMVKPPPGFPGVFFDLRL